MTAIRANEWLTKVELEEVRRKILTPGNGEENQEICCTNQLTGFYMRATLAFNGLMTSL